MREVLLFTGWSASGKSTLAKEVNQNLGYFYIKERDILHDLAIASGFRRTREWLAAKGTQNVFQAATKETVRQISDLGSANCLIDGSYDRCLPHILRANLSYTRVTIISVIASLEERERRMMGRLGVSLEEARKEKNLIDGFKRDAGIEDLISHADISIDNMRPLVEAVSQLESGLKARQVQQAVFV